MPKVHAVLLCFILGIFASCTPAGEITPPTATPIPSTTPVLPTMTPQITETPLPTADPPAPVDELYAESSIQTRGVIYDLDWSPDGDVLASTGYGEVNLWDTIRGSLIEKLIVGEGTVWDVEWNRDGQQLAILGDTNACSVWDNDSGALTQIPVMLTVKSASWSPKDPQIAVGLIVQRFEVLDMENQRLLFSGPTIHGVWGIEWSPDGQWIATAEFDGYIKVWDGATGNLLKTYHSGWMGTNALSVAWSPDGRWLASTHRDGRVRIWALDSDDGTPFRVLERQSGWARGLAWSPDGRLIVSTHGQGPRDDYFAEPDQETYGGAAYLWDAASGALLAVMEKDHPTPIWSAAWSPDGETLALGTGTFHDWTGESGILIHTLP